MLKKILLLLAVLCSSETYGQRQNGTIIQPDQKIQVQINRNVELLGFVYFLVYEGKRLENNDANLAGRDIKQKDWYGYGLSLYHKYKSFENSRHLKIAIGFAENIWLDYFINLLIQIDDFPNAELKPEIEPKHYIRFSAKRDTLEAKNNAAVFIESLNQLSKEVDFNSYFIQSQNIYQNAISQVQAGLPDGQFIPAMENFYRQRYDQYTMVPSLTIPTGMGFGAKYNLDDKTRVFNVFGPFGVQHFTDDANVDMGFTDRKHLLELSTHEFGHSFVNPVIDKLPRELLISTEGLFSPIKDAMANQGYTTWKACLDEHFVRAGEIIIAQNLGRNSDAQVLKSGYIQNRKFIYLPVILEELQSYNNTKTLTYQQAVERTVKNLSLKVAKN